MFQFEKFTRDEELGFDAETILVAPGFPTYIEAPSRDQVGSK
jgi:hypothetical protein